MLLDFGRYLIAFCCFAFVSIDYEVVGGQDLSEYFESISDSVDELRSENTEIARSAAANLDTLLASIPIADWVNDKSLGKDLMLHADLRVSDARKLLFDADPKVALATLSLISRFGKHGSDYKDVMREIVDDASSPRRAKRSAIQSSLFVADESASVITPESSVYFFEIFDDSPSVLDHRSQRIRSESALLAMTFEAEALSQILMLSGHTRSHTSLFCNLAKSGDYRSRLLSLLILGNLGIESSSAIPTLNQILLKDEDALSEVAGYAIVAITQDNGQIDRIVDILQLDEEREKLFVKKCHMSLERQKQEEDTVREFLLDPDQDPDAISWLRTRLVDGRGYERRFLLHILLNTPRSDSKVNLERELQTLSSDSDPVTKELASRLLIRVRSSQPKPPN